jgi:beta-lactamase class A
MASDPGTVAPGLRLSVRRASPRTVVLDQTPVPWKVRIEGRRAAASRRRALERTIAAIGGAVIAAGVTIAAVLPPSPFAPTVLGAVHDLPTRFADIERRATGFAIGLVPSRPAPQGPWAASRENQSLPLPPLPTVIKWFPPPTYTASRPTGAQPTSTRATIRDTFPPTATVAASVTPFPTTTAIPTSTAAPSATAVPTETLAPTVEPSATAVPEPSATAIPASRTPVPARPTATVAPTVEPSANEASAYAPHTPVEGLWSGEAAVARPSSGGAGPQAQPPDTNEPLPRTPPSLVGQGVGELGPPPDSERLFPTPTAEPSRHVVTLPRADAALLDAIRSGLTIDPELAAISVLHLETGIAAALHDDRIAVPASLYKVGVLAEAYRQIEAGTLRTDEPLRLLPTDWAPGAGILQGRIGSQVSVADALRLMIGISDNVAAHAIVRRIGVDHVNANNQRLGLAETRYYVDDRPDTTTASDMARLLSLLAQGKVAGPEATAQMIALMRQVQPAAWLPKGVPGTVPVAHKSGQLGGVRNDAGIVYGPTGPYVVVVLTDNRRDPSLGERTITSVARSVHAFFAAGG